MECDKSTRDEKGKNSCRQIDDPVSISEETRGQEGVEEGKGVILWVTLKNIKDDGIFPEKS